MPLDRKDSGSTWQGPQRYKFTEMPPDAPWEPTDEVDIPLIQQEQELPTGPAESNALHLGTNDPSEDENAGKAISARTELMNQIGYYSSFVLAPLLFAGLTSLIVLPLVANGHAKLPPQTLIPLAIVILAIALAQGIAIYYAGTTNGLWAIYTAVGFFLFMLVGCFALFGLIVGIVVLLIFIGLSIFLAQRYIHPVAEEYADIVRSFGKYKRTLYPGFNILLPWEQISHHLSTAETTWKTPIQHVQMTRDEDVVLRGSMSYQLLPEDAHLATSVKNWEESLQDNFIASLQAVAKTFTPEDFIAWPKGMYTRPTHGSVIPLSEGEARWEQVNGLVLQRVQNRAMDWGVLIKEVRLYDISLAPHGHSLQDETTAPIVQRNVDAAVPRQPTPQPQQAPQPIVAQPQQPRPSAPIQQSVASTQVPKGLKEETLRKAYTEVKNGNIKEAETIRNLAAQFDAVAHDPELNKSFTFDAGRAALNLYAEADRRQEEEEANAGTLFTDETKVDWPRRRATDENLMGGG
ncbi:MAG: hypothetical protein PVSMB2_23070 [Ktedonobacteraceae bacterium]